MQLMKEKQDLTYLSWSVYRNSSGTAGSFLKAYSELGGKKTYYKLSNFDKARGVIGHECVNELIVDRLLTILGIPHLSYQLIHADVSVEALPDESALEFCTRMGWEDYIYQMLVVDYLILNRDRHGANIEVLRNSRKKTVRLAPLFDHGLSLLCSCSDDAAAAKFDVMADKPCNNYIGSKSTWDNLRIIPKDKMPKLTPLHESDRQVLLEGLDGVISQTLQNKIWEMIWKRWCAYEDFCHSR